MPPVDICIRPPFSRTLRQYFQTVFPSAIRSGPHAVLSLDSPTLWLTKDSLDLYHKFTSHAGCICIAEYFRYVHCTSAQRLSEYRDFLLPPGIRNNPIFSLDHPEYWVSPVHLKCFLEHIVDASDISVSCASAVLMSPTITSSTSSQLYTPRSDFSNDFPTRTEAWKCAVTSFWAPTPRAATSVTQLELSL